MTARKWPITGLNLSLKRCRLKNSKVVDEPIAMPRGSKPGERRGGRQRGTPNKQTVLKNAVLSAAAANPNSLPLQFFLALMRDPNGPMDTRIDMAQAAAPFVHTKPQRPSRVRTNPMDSGPLKSVPDFSVARMEEALRPGPARRRHRGGIRPRRARRRRRRRGL